MKSSHTITVELNDLEVERAIFKVSEDYIINQSLLSNEERNVAITKMDRHSDGSATVSYTVHLLGGKD